MRFNGHGFDGAVQVWASKVDAAAIKHRLAQAKDDKFNREHRPTEMVYVIQNHWFWGIRQQEAEAIISLKWGAYIQRKLYDGKIWFEWTYDGQVLHQLVEILGEGDVTVFFTPDQSKLYHKIISNLKADGWYADQEARMRIEVKAAEESEETEEVVE
jgi:hypothetical protein